MITVQRTRHFVGQTEPRVQQPRESDLGVALAMLLRDADNLDQYSSIEITDGRLTLHLRSSFIDHSHEAVVYAGPAAEMELLKQTMGQALHYRCFTASELVRYMTTPDAGLASQLPAAEIRALAGQFKQPPWRIMAIITAFTLPPNYEVVLRYADYSQLDNFANLVVQAHQTHRRFEAVEREAADQSAP